MNYEETQSLRDQLRKSYDQAIALFNNQHPIYWNDYEIVDRLRSLGVEVRNGSGISRLVTFPPTEQHSLNIELRKAYTEAASAKFEELVKSADTLTGRAIPQLVMEYSGFLINYKPQVRLVMTEGENDETPNR